MSAPPIAVVGIGAEGWAGLGEPARTALLAAEEVVGSERQLALLPATVTARRRTLPSPLEPLLDELAARVDGAAGVPASGEPMTRADGAAGVPASGEPTTRAHAATCVLASGDPMLHGIGASLARRLGPERLAVHPHPSAFALACARLGWAAADVALVSAVARPPEVVARVLQPGRRLVVYATGQDGAAQVARVLRERGFGPSRFVVLEQLGGAAERIHESTAEHWGERDADPLHAVAVECRPAPGVTPLPRTPGLPDDAYEHAGQITKRGVRALTLAALAPLPGQLLWDVGAGSGSIAIEWLRAEPIARAVAIEARSDRAAQVARNASRLGVPGLAVRHGSAPAMLADLDPPDAVFLGGGLAEQGLIDDCWAALRSGGRLVANAVTLEGERALHAACATYGGELTRIELSHAEPLGSFTSWRPQRPIVQWAATKEDA